MSIKTSELQQLSPLTGAERLLADSPGAGTGLIPFNEAAQFLGGELVKPGSAVGAALELHSITWGPGRGGICWITPILPFGRGIPTGNSQGCRMGRILRTDLPLQTQTAV